MGLSLTTKRAKGKYPPVPLKGALVKVGFPAGKSAQSNIMKAIYNEFGTRHIPARPFLRTAVRNNRSKYQAMMKRDSKAILKGDMTVQRAMNRLGLVAVGDVQRSIVAGNWEPNAASTIARKKSSRPLIDTGAMRQAVTWIVEDA